MFNKIMTNETIQDILLNTLVTLGLGISGLGVIVAMLFQTGILLFIGFGVLILALILYLCRTFYRRVVKPIRKELRKMDANLS